MDVSFCFGNAQIQLVNVAVRQEKFAFFSYVVPHTVVSFELLLRQLFVLRKLDEFIRFRYEVLENIVYDEGFGNARAHKKNQHENGYKNIFHSNFSSLRVRSKLKIGRLLGCMTT